MSTEKDEAVGPLDADDVEGHVGRHHYGVAPTDDDDVEGHVGRHHYGVAPTDDDDVEGHWTSKQHL
jgi:hypothetical protein